jgi:peroxiredoxin
MKKILPVLLFIIAPFIIKAQADIDASTLIKVGDTAPNFEFSISKDQKANLADYKGKIVMINFFATWCGPCGLELPRVQKEIWDKYKNNPKFALFIFGRDEGWEKVLPFKEKNKYTFLMLPDVGKKIYSLYATQYIPRNVVIDENGKIIYQSTSYSEQEFSSLVKVLDKKLK